jgi:hypothetical protein
MRFVALDPFVEQQPLVEVGPAGGRVDLHNDATLREVAINLAAQEVRLVWTLRSPAWRNLDYPLLEDRDKTGTATLIFGGVSRLAIGGAVIGHSREGLGELDFIEYHRSSPGLGEVRFITDPAAAGFLAVAVCH